MTRRVMVVLAVSGLMLFGAAAATAATITSSLQGGATVTSSGAVQLTSDLTDTSTTNDAGSIVFTMPAGTTFADLKTLSTDFEPTAGSPASGSPTPLGCGGGSPRFSITLASGKNVFVFLGPSPNFNSCALSTWESSGNLIGNNDTGRYDTSQVQAGTQSNTYSGALSLLGSQQVTSISLVVDAGWAFTPQVQTVLVRNVQVNGQTFFGPSARTTNPAMVCKAELATMGTSAFERTYGDNHNLRDAFGKCVSEHATSMHASSAASSSTFVRTSVHARHARSHHHRRR